MSESALWRVAMRSTLFAVGLILSLYVLYLLRGVMVQLLLAVIIAAGMTPLVERLAPTSAARVGRWWERGLPRPVAVLFVYLALLGAIAGLGAAVIPPAAAQVRELAKDAPRYLEELQRWANGLSDRYPFLPSGMGEMLPAQLQSGAGQLRGVLDQALVALGLVLEALQGILNFVFILFLALYLTTDAERIRRYFISFLPADRRGQAETVTAHIGERLGGWVRGQIALSGIIGGITLVGLLVIGVPYAVLLALVAAIGEAVPMIGPIISAVPAVIVAFFDSPLKGLVTIGLYIIVQQVENVFVVPKVMERAVSLHPLAVMMALLIGGELYGVTGAILSVPVAAAISVVVNEVRQEWRDNEYARLETPPAASATVEQPEADPGAGPEHHGG
jgi:predicted PurR-regulated permease PerM